MYMYIYVFKLKTILYLAQSLLLKALVVICIISHIFSIQIENKIKLLYIFQDYAGSQIVSQILNFFYA